MKIFSVVAKNITQNEAYDKVIFHGEKILAHRHTLHLRPSSMVASVCTAASQAQGDSQPVPPARVCAEGGRR
jgi:hypothetical protein